MPRLTLRPDGSAPVDVELEIQRDPSGGTRFRLCAGEEVLAGEASLPFPGEGLLNLGARRVPFYWARRGDALEVWVDGETYRFAGRGSERAAASAEALPADGVVAAPMPGLVLNVLAKPGQEVAAQAPLVVLESMKMELTVAAPAAGRVAEILAAAGQRVDLGTPLVRLEEGGAQQS